MSGSTEPRERRCEVVFTKSHTWSCSEHGWLITAPDGSIFLSCDKHLAYLLYLNGTNDVRRVDLDADVSS